MIKRVCILLGLLLFSCAVFGQSIDSKKLTFGCFASLAEGHAFWKAHQIFMEAVCEDLNVNLYYKYLDNNQFLQIKQLEELSQIDPSTNRKKIDAALIVNFKLHGEIFFKALDKGNLPGMVNVSGADYIESGKPRQKHPFWIGDVVIDEVEVGYKLALALFKEADRLKLKADDGKIHVVAINGDVSTLLSLQRLSGLEKAVKERSDIILEQVFITPNWSRVEATEKFLGAKLRYPKANVFWAANDDIALGIIDGAKSKSLIPGKDIITGGIDWVPEALQAIKKGEMVTSFGGLSFHGGWAAIAFYDYLNGIDFINDTGVTIKTECDFLDKTNINLFLEKFGDGNWRKVDFKKFSKKLNPSLKKYDFSLNNLMLQM